MIFVKLAIVFAWGFIAFGVLDCGWAFIRFADLPSDVLQNPHDVQVEDTGLTVAGWFSREVASGLQTIALGIALGCLGQIAKRHI